MSEVVTYSSRVFGLIDHGGVDVKLRDIESKFINERTNQFVFIYIENVIFLKSVDFVAQRLVLGVKNGGEIRPLKQKFVVSHSLYLKGSKTAGPFLTRLFEFILSFGLVIHAAHAARWHWRSFFLFRNLRHLICSPPKTQLRSARSSSLS